MFCNKKEQSAFGLPFCFIKIMVNLESLRTVENVGPKPSHLLTQELPKVGAFTQIIAQSVCRQKPNRTCERKVLRTSDVELASAI